MSTSPTETPVSPLPPKHTKIHLGYLDGLRAFAAIYVLLHHMYLQSPLAGGPSVAMKLTKIFNFGHLSVDLFIVLSGFCLMLPVARGDGFLRGTALAFYKKRARRILPPYFATIAVSLLFIALWIGETSGSHWDIAIPVVAKDIWIHVFLLQDILGNAKINPVLWSVSVEWRIYFLFPLLVFAFRRFGPVLTTAITVVASYLFWLAMYLSPLASRQIVDTTWQGCSPYYLGLFAMGMLAAHIVFSGDARLNEWRDHMNWGAVTAVALALFVVMMALPAKLGIDLPRQFMSFFIGLACMALLIWISVRPQAWAARLFSWRPLVFMGTFAYSIYLMHAPLMQLFWKFAVHPLHQNTFREFLIMLIVGTPVILGACYLFFLAFERPFLNTRRKETTAETERDAALSPAP
jgi:peptidoglycan/LPS O-acetylase OafA/YrhL